MRKMMVSLFIGFFILTGSAFAEPTCGCCGASGHYEYPYGVVSPSRKIIVWDCSCSSHELAFLCIHGKCRNCCSCEGSSGGSGGGSSSHTCSFKNICSETHCSKYVCDGCGRHKNDAECGGGCNSSGRCTHCSVRYCSKCDDHRCTHNKSGYCSKPHCTSRVYCSKCGHTCDGDHKYGSLTCSLAHCTDLVCTVSGCTEHKSGACGGGHTEGRWIEENGVHNRYCGRTDLGCNEIVATHGILWGAPNVNHTSTCVQGCGLTYTHTPSWGTFFNNGSIHVRNCTVSVGGSSCSATDSHSPVWSEYVKADDGGEESGSEHLRRCTVTDCKLTSGEHFWADDVKWIAINEEQHKRTCPTCSLTQTLSHDFVDREAIDEDIENHYKVCAVCVDNEDNKYKLYEKHIDEETDGRGNGICDLCNKELWRIDISNEMPTNQDITVKVEIFSDYEDRIKLPGKMTDEYGNEVIKEDGVYTIGKNGQYIFTFETPDRDVIVNIKNISKDIYGKIFITPDTATMGEVTLRLVTSTEGVDKIIDLKYQDEAWNENVLELTKTVENNGTYTFYARDNLGNSKTFFVNISNIVSGFGSVTTTYDAFQNGYIFTDILVNINQAWVVDDALINCLKGSVYKYKVDGDGLKTPVSINKVYITDEYGNRVTEKVLNSGTYYLRVAIGGQGVFDDVGTYMIEIMNVSIENNGVKLVTLEGKNRIEVVVQSLNDLT